MSLENHPGKWKAVKMASSLVLDADGKILLSNIPLWLAEHIVALHNAEEAQMRLRLYAVPSEQVSGIKNKFAAIGVGLSARFRYHLTPKEAINAAVEWLEKNKEKSDEPTKGRCPTCGQIDCGQTGEYPCPICGLPLTWDESFSKKWLAEREAGK